MDPKELLNKINAELARRYKSNAPELIMASDLPPIEWISTGMLGYDWINGGGGPRGHCEQIYGRRSSGKTTVVLRRIAECQRLGGVAAYIDVEHTLDKAWAKTLGVDLDKLILHEPIDEPAHIVLGTVEELLRSGEVDMIALDSIPALADQAKLDNELGEKTYGGISILMTDFYTRVVGTGLLYQSNCVLILVNQPRDVIGSRIPMERLPGGRALGHMCSIITETRQGDYLTKKEDGEEVKIGIEVHIINKKNKVRWPFREYTLRLHFANGFNPLWDVIQFARRYGIIENRGAWAYYEEESMGQGIDNNMQWLINNSDKYYEIKNKVLELIRRGK